MVGVKARDGKQRRVDCDWWRRSKKEKGGRARRSFHREPAAILLRGKFRCVPWLYPGLLNKRCPRPPRTNTPSHLNRAIVPAVIIISSLWCMNWGVSRHLWGALGKWEWRRSSKIKNERQLRLSLDGHWLKKPKWLQFFLLQSKKPHSVIALFPLKALQWGQVARQKRLKKRGKGCVFVRVKVMEGGGKKKK